MPYKGARPNMRMRFNDGTWKQPESYPWCNEWLAGETSQLRDTNATYPLTRIELSDANGIYGVLDGVLHISGFNNATENTIDLNGETWIVIQDVSRTGFNDYYVLRMDS